LKSVIIHFKTFLAPNIEVEVELQLQQQVEVSEKQHRIIFMSYLILCEIT